MPVTVWNTQQQTCCRTFLHEKGFNLGIPGMAHPSYLQFKSNQLFVQIILVHTLRKKQINTKAITDLKECKCRRRAELGMTTNKWVCKLFCVNYQNPLWVLAPVLEQAAFYRLAVMTHTDDSWNTKYSDIVIPSSAIRILEVSSPIPLGNLECHIENKKGHKVVFIISHHSANIVIFFFCVVINCCFRTLNSIFPWKI